MHLPISGRGGAFSRTVMGALEGSVLSFTAGLELRRKGGIWGGGRQAVHCVGISAPSVVGLQTHARVLG